MMDDGSVDGTVEVGELPEWSAMHERYVARER